MGQRVMLAVGFAAISLGMAAKAEERIFVIPNHADGYGVERCLSTGATCGTPIAAAYCRAHDYSEARWFRKVDPEDITGSVPVSTNTCTDERCADMVAIACSK
jgi:hypothetical protein